MCWLYWEPDTLQKLCQLCTKARNNQRARRVHKRAKSAPIGKKQADIQTNQRLNKRAELTALFPQYISLGWCKSRIRDMGLKFCCRIWLGMRDSNPRSWNQNPLPYHLANPHRRSVIVMSLYRRQNKFDQQDWWLYKVFSSLNSQGLVNLEWKQIRLTRGDYTVICSIWVGYDRLKMLTI